MKKLMTMNYKSSIVLLFTIISIQVYSQKITNMKDVSQEVPAQKGTLVRIVSSSYKLDVKTWNQNKVRITTQVNDSAAKSKTDEAWFEDLGITVKAFSNRVDILSRATARHYPVSTNKFHGNVSPTYITEVPAEKLTRALIASPGVNHTHWYASKNPPPVITIMIPEGANIDVDNRYADVVISANLDEASIEITNGALDLQDVKNLKLTGKYCNANVGSIQSAELEFYNGTFRAMNIDDLDIDSKSSVIEYETGKTIYLRSQSDNYSIDEIDKVDGRKTYGSLRIDKLNTSFELEGTNADIKFRNISPDVEFVKINNKYGDVRVPVKNLKNYSVNFTGNYSTVFAPFEKKVVEEKASDTEKLAAEKEMDQGALKAITVTQSYRNLTFGNEQLSPRRFTSAVGDTKGRHTKFELVCHSCTLDFK